MKLMRPIKKESVKAYAFIIIAAVSILTLLPPTNNYIQFYKAIEKLNITASRSNFTFYPDNYRALVLINTTIENPTGYSGIGIVSLMFDLNFIRNNTIVQLRNGYRIWFKDEPGEPVEPYSSVSKGDELTLNLENKKDTFEEIKTLQQTGGEIELRLDDVALDTSLFLGRMIIPAGSTPLNGP
jgi:hypothetical protein